MPRDASQLRRSRPRANAPRFALNHAETVQAAKDNWERVPRDYYPTPPETTQALVDFLAPLGRLRVLEPCCGEGHIARVLEAAGHDVVASDIRDTGYGEGGVDYLAKPEAPDDAYEFDAVITNPPFSHAEDVIRRALRDAPLVAMLLGNDYWHAASRARLFNSRKPRAVLALTWRPIFLVERGSSPLANMAWTVWDDEHEGDTRYLVVNKPPSFPALPPPDAAVRIARTGLLDGLRASLAARAETGG